jgi:hypothetical protein
MPCTLLPMGGGSNVAEYVPRPTLADVKLGLEHCSYTFGHYLGYYFTSVLCPPSCSVART